MNALTKITETPEAELIQVLRDSIWPGAKDTSIKMALAYCRVNELDPFLKPVHIVPMWDKNTGSMRDVLLPSIADYRIKASRTGEYAGIDEPVFGPDITTTWPNMTVTHPEWCKITIYRIVKGVRYGFTAREEWLENYAIKGGKERLQSPNDMWAKRIKGQLAKCAEAQALRKAFPEFSGGQPTAEEMEGKTFDNFAGPTNDGEAAKPEPPSPAKPAAKSPSEKTIQARDSAINQLTSCEDPDEWIALDSKSQKWRRQLAAAHPEISAQVEEAFAAARDRLFPPADGEREPGMEG